MVNENHDKVESMFVIKITFLAVILSSFIYYIFIYILPFLFAFFLDLIISGIFYGKFKCTRIYIRHKK